MHGAIVSLPRLMDSCTTGAARSTSQVVKMTSAPWLSSRAAQDLAVAGLFPCVSQVLISRLTPGPRFTCRTRSLAVASAGPSNGAIAPLPSKAQPIVTVFACCGEAEPTATAAAETATTPNTARTVLRTPIILALLCGAQDRNPRVGIPVARRTPEDVRRWRSPRLCRERLWTVSSVVLLALISHHPHVSPRFFLPFDERVERSMERNLDAVPLRLPDERAGDELDLRLPARVDEPVYDVSQVGRLVLGREVRVVPEAGDRRDRVHRRVEDELRPLRRSQ